MNHRNSGVIDIRQLRPPRIPLGLFGAGILAILVVGMLFSMFFTVGPEEVGVIQRFGKFIGTREPGLRWKLPYPIETVKKVPVQRQLKVEFGFRTDRPGVRTRYDERDFEDEALMLTGDLNVAEVEWIAQYRVADPYKYLFKVRDVENTFRYMNEAVMRRVVGDRSVNEVLTVGRAEIALEAEQILQEMCDQYEMGIRVEQIVLQNVTPPDDVKPSFNEVNQAEQEKERRINEARTAYNQVIPRARGEALRTVQEAEGYAADRINRSKGDASAFEAVLAAYQQAPEVTRRRIYLETMAAVYPKVQRKVVFDQDMKGVLPLLDLGKEGK